MLAARAQGQAGPGVDYHVGRGDMGVGSPLHHPRAVDLGTAVAGDRQLLVAFDHGVAQPLGGVLFVAFDEAGAVAANLLETVVINQAAAVAGDVFGAVAADCCVAVVQHDVFEIALCPQKDFFLPGTVFN